MESLIPIITISTVVIVIGFIKYRDFRNKKINPPKKWEGKTQSESAQDKENIERKAEAQKGNGRAGGPF
ncbi:hypothetical protein [Halobacillus sp. H74]|uniref:hypothetical protein n=1 Tax=Halobacillus sp. H74 TaxID=3457436 RepID=UPI003FCD8308